MAPKKRQQTRGSGVWELVRRQHGVISRRQLEMLGFGTEAIRHRLRTGRLIRVHQGVYSVGRPELTRRGHWAAAVLACGDGAMLSHGSAAALWGIGRERAPIEISIPRAAHLRRQGLKIHRRTGLGPDEKTVHQGIPVTSAALTVLDHACQLPRTRMERMVNEADRLDLVKPPALRAFLDAHPRRDGVERLKRLLDRRTFLFTETELENAFLPVAAAAGLPVPLTAQQVNGFKVDFFWPLLGLVVETDGLRYHRTPAEQARDRLRDQAHTASGLTPLRFTHDQIKYEPAHVRAVLAATVVRLGARAA